jgi:guanine deaminase
MAPTYTLYHGTFIQLPRSAPPSGTKHDLSINTGALWVSNADGRIKGFDWSVGIVTAEELNAFVQTKGWTIIPEGTVMNGTTTTEGGKETVTIVAGGRKGRNGFFFPGFIGEDISII